MGFNLNSSPQDAELLDETKVNWLILFLCQHRKKQIFVEDYYWNINELLLDNTLIYSYNKKIFHFFKFHHYLSS